MHLLWFSITTQNTKKNNMSFQCSQNVFYRKENYIKKISWISTFIPWIENDPIERWIKMLWKLYGNLLVHLIKSNTGHSRLAMEEKEFLPFCLLSPRLTFFSRSVNNNYWSEEMEQKKAVYSLRLLPVAINLPVLLCILYAVYLSQQHGAPHITNTWYIIS